MKPTVAATPGLAQPAYRTAWVGVVAIGRSGMRCHGDDPVSLPTLPVVVGEGLLEACRPSGDVLPDVPDLDPVAAHYVLAEEPATPVAEAALHRGIQLSGSAGGGPPDPPPAGRGVEQPQRDGFQRLAVGRDTGRREQVDVPQPSKDGMRLPGGLELDPVGTVRIQRVRQPAVVEPPPAKDKVEVVTAVAGDLWRVHGVGLLRAVKPARQVAIGWPNAAWVGRRSRCWCPS